MKPFFSNMLVGLFVIVQIFAVGAAQASSQQDKTILSERIVGFKKAYPGGRDEEDLIVQDELKPATQTVDRRSIELHVLKTYFKKTDAELVAPSKTEEEQ